MSRSRPKSEGVEEYAVVEEAKAADSELVKRRPPTWQQRGVGREEVGDGGGDGVAALVGVASGADEGGEAGADGGEEDGHRPRDLIFSRWIESNGGEKSEAQPRCCAATHLFTGRRRSSGSAGCRRRWWSASWRSRALSSGTTAPSSLPTHAVASPRSLEATVPTPGSRSRFEVPTPSSSGDFCAIDELDLNELAVLPPMPHPQQLPKELDLPEFNVVAKGIGFQEEVEEEEEVVEEESPSASIEVVKEVIHNPEHQRRLTELDTIDRR